MKQLKLKEKHLNAVEKKNFWSEKIDALIDKIKQDTSGACWNIDEVADYTRKKAIELDAQPYEHRVLQPFWGLSVGVKDLFTIKGLRTTAGSKMLENFISPYDSTLWKDLECRGALLGAKLAMDEFAMGSYTNTSPFGRTSVPGYKEHTAGGSSGGSAAAVAANLVDFSIGSDTGGSVRLPAAFCSVFGYKPSYGAFSRHGMIPYASSLDQAGFLTNNFEDLSYILETGIAHKCEYDSTSKGLDLIHNRAVSKIKIAYIPSIFNSPDIADDVKSEYQALLNTHKPGKFLSCVDFVPVEIPLLKHATSIYYIIACAEAASNLSKFQGVFFGQKLVEQNFHGSYWEQCAQYRSKFFGEEVQKRLMIAAHITSGENFGSILNNALELRNQLTQKIDDVLRNNDMLVLPTSPFSSPKWDEIDKMTSSEIYMADALTVPFSLAGLPVVSVPIKRDKNKLGVGLQFVGRRMGDYQLLKNMEYI